MSSICRYRGRYWMLYLLLAYAYSVISAKYSWKNTLISFVCGSCGPTLCCFITKHLRKHRLGASYLFIYLFIYLSIYLFIYINVCLFIYLLTYFFVCLFIYLLFVVVPLCCFITKHFHYKTLMFVHLFIYLFVCMFVHLFPPKAHSNEVLVKVYYILHHACTHICTKSNFKTPKLFKDMALHIRPITGCIYKLSLHKQFYKVYTGNYNHVIGIYIPVRPYTLFTVSTVFSEY